MKKLLYAGIVGPLLFIVVFLIEGATRPGYSAWRNMVSQLATGDGGWLQVLNFLLWGTLAIVFAIGLRSALTGTRGSIAAPAFFVLYGVALLAAGIFSTDPGLGYPPGAPVVHTTHGLIHGFSGLTVFVSLAAAAFVMSVHFATESGARVWAIYSAAVGALILGFFFGGFALSAIDSSQMLGGLYQRITIIAGWTWISMLALHLLRSNEVGDRSGAVADELTSRPR